jgi:seryl-tRNA synthetase
MLPLDFVIENIEKVQENCTNRNVNMSLAGLPPLVAKRREIIREVENARAEQNALAKKGEDPDQREHVRERVAALKKETRTLEESLKEVETSIDAVLEQIPNISHPEAPIGRGEADNAVREQVGTPPEWSFRPRDHVELGKALDLIDFDSGSRVAGSSFYFLKNEAVLLEVGFLRYALDILRKRGFVLHSTPDLASTRVLGATGYNPRGDETQIYSVQGTDLCLIATAEIPLGGMLMDQTVPEKALPMKLAGISHCFRTEAGAYGRAAKGLYRVHQFTKAEMFIFCSPEESEAMLEEMVRIEKEIFEGLEIPFRVVDCCTGDLGGPAYRKFDLEAWMPGRGERGEWGEITSASNCTDYQARRLKSRYKPSAGKKTRLLHTLNGTALAVSRALVALLENHQREDGSVRIPAKLQPYVGFETISRKMR